MEGVGAPTQQVIDRQWGKTMGLDGVACIRKTTSQPWAEKFIYDFAHGECMISRRDRMLGQ